MNTDTIEIINLDFDYDKLKSSYKRFNEYRRTDKELSELGKIADRVMTDAMWQKLGEDYGS